MKTSAKHLPSSWALGQATWAKNNPKTTSLMALVTNNPHLPTKKFFFWVQSTRLADPFKPLNSSLVQSAKELERW